MSSPESRPQRHRPSAGSRQRTTAELLSASLACELECALASRCPTGCGRKFSSAAGIFRGFGALSGSTPSSAAFPPDAISNPSRFHRLSWVFRPVPFAEETFLRVFSLPRFIWRWSLRTEPWSPFAYEECLTPESGSPSTADSPPSSGISKVPTTSGFCFLPRLFCFARSAWRLSSIRLYTLELAVSSQPSFYAWLSFSGTRVLEKVQKSRTRRLAFSFPVQFSSGPSPFLTFFISAGFVPPKVPATSFAVFPRARFISPQDSGSKHHSRAYESQLMGVNDVGFPASGGTEGDEGKIASTDGTVESIRSALAWRTTQTWDGDRAGQTFEPYVTFSSQ